MNRVANEELRRVLGLSECNDLGEVLNKDRALSLPSHRPYDGSIDLIPGAPLPSSRLCNLSRPEGEGLWKPT